MILICWMPIKVSRQGPALSHHFFVDDLMLFTSVERGQIDVIMDYLNQFAAVSGLVINLGKSKLFVSPNVQRSVANGLSHYKNYKN